MKISRKLVFAGLLLTAGAAFSQPVSASAQAQIACILNAKRQLNNSQKKVVTNLVLAAKAARGEMAGSPCAHLFSAPQTDQSGRVTVDIKGTVGPIVTLVGTLGGQVVAQHPQHGAVRAKLPLQALERLAASSDVRSINSEEKALTNVGALTSQGYVSHQAQNVVVGLGHTGAGVKVGVLSDSASSTRVAALIASGDLNANTVVLDAGIGNSNEGTAIMEVIQDLAPGAQLHFATAFNGKADFAAKIAALAAAGCTIIVDNVTYFNEAAFQDDVIAQAVSAFVANGGLYFSAAGNGGNLTSGTTGTWEGDFQNGGVVDSGPISTFEGKPVPVHNFGTVGTPVLFNTLTAIGSGIALQWSDPLGASNNDYDLLVLNSAGTTVKGFSTSFQTGTQDPVEIINNSSLSVGDRIVVVLFSGEARALRLEAIRGRVSIATAGSIYGHAASAGAMSVAASSWNSARTGAKPMVGGAANPVEAFSSDGPRKYFYNANGTAITPGNVLFAGNGGTTLQKPDMTAVDGVGVQTPGFFPFYGTSASAAHAAGIAALIKSAKPSYTAAQIVTAMKESALDIMAAGVDRDSGAGLVMALAAVNYALAH